MNPKFVKLSRCHPERPSEPERRSEGVEGSAVAFQRTLDSPHVQQSLSILRHGAALLQPGNVPAQHTAEEEAAPPQVLKSRRNILRLSRGSGTAKAAWAQHSRRAQRKIRSRSREHSPGDAARPAFWRDRHAHRLRAGAQAAQSAQRSSRRRSSPRWALSKASPDSKSPAPATSTPASIAPRQFAW